MLWGVGSSGCRPIVDVRNRSISSGIDFSSGADHQFLRFGFPSERGPTQCRCADNALESIWPKRALVTRFGGRRQWTSGTSRPFCGRLPQSARAPFSRTRWDGQQLVKSIARKSRTEESTIELAGGSTWRSIPVEGKASRMEQPGWSVGTEPAVRGDAPLGGSPKSTAGDQA